MAGSHQCTYPAWLCVSLPAIPIVNQNIEKYPRHPSEPQCSYDPVEGLALAPEIDAMEKIRLLEEQIGGCNDPIIYNFN
jgi:hypothetical protein